MSSSSTETAPVHRPQLSVIVVAFNDQNLLSRCLEALAPETRELDVETLVVSKWRSARTGGREGLSSTDGRVRWIEAAANATVPQMRAKGLSESRGEIVAFIEDDCLVQPRWCPSILAAHRGFAAAIGGAVEPGPYRQALDWAVYFCDYGRFMLPLAAGPAVALAGNNMSFKRDALRTLPAGLAYEFEEVFVHRAWQRDGIPMCTDPAVVVKNVNSWKLADVTVIPYHHGRAFAGRRFGDQRLWRRGTMSLFALLLPALKVLRVVRETVSRRRRLGALVRALPLIGVLATSWSIGESVGYLRGPGDSASRWR